MKHKKNGDSHYRESPLCRGDRIRTCDHLVPKPGALPDCATPRLTLTCICQNL